MILGDHICSYFDLYTAAEVTRYQIFVTSVTIYGPYLKLWSCQIMFSANNLLALCSFLICTWNSSNFLNYNFVNQERSFLWKSSRASGAKFNLEARDCLRQSPTTEGTSQHLQGGHWGGTPGSGGAGGGTTGLVFYEKHRFPGYQSEPTRDYPPLQSPTGW